jgi:hypothetical protein
MNMPLFAGFAAKPHPETLALEDKARNDLDAARRNVAQATRTAFYGLVSGASQVKAWRRPNPRARSRSMPTAWATRSACASTSTC